MDAIRHGLASPSPARARVTAETIRKFLAGVLSRRVHYIHRAAAVVANALLVNLEETNARSSLVTSLCESECSEFFQRVLGLF